MRNVEKSWKNMGKQVKNMRKDGKTVRKSTPKAADGLVFSSGVSYPKLFNRKAAVGESVALIFLSSAQDGPLSVPFET